MPNPSYEYFTQEVMPEAAYLEWLYSSEAERTQLLPFIERSAHWAQNDLQADVQELSEEEELAAIRAFRIFTVTADPRAISHALKLEIYLDREQFEVLADVASYYLGEVARQEHFHLLFNSWLEYRHQGGGEDEVLLGLMGRHCVLNDQVRARIREHIFHGEGFIKGLALPDVFDQDIFQSVYTRLKDLAPIIFFFPDATGEDLEEEWEELSRYWVALKLDPQSLQREREWSEEQKKAYLMREIQSDDQLFQKLQDIISNASKERADEKSREEKLIEDTFFHCLPDSEEDWLDSPAHTPFQSQFIDSMMAEEQEFLRQIKRKVGRNDPCPCASGKKYKKCCGA